MSTNYIVAGWCYAISALLDAVDGHAARAFNQSKYHSYGLLSKIKFIWHCMSMGVIKPLSKKGVVFMVLIVNEEGYFYFTLQLNSDFIVQTYYSSNGTLVS